MIVGIGCDIIKIARIQSLIERVGDKFLSRIYTQSEIATGLKLPKEKGYAYFAKRFAAKEAVSKALGTGIGEAVSFLDIEIENAASGKPMVRLVPQQFAKFSVHLTLADEDDSAIAYAIAEKIIE
jgi:holo-[acyl-carrier protein] synthase